MSAVIYAAKRAVAAIPDAPPVNGAASPRAPKVAVNPASIPAPIIALIKALLQSTPPIKSITNPIASPANGIYFPTLFKKSGIADPMRPSNPFCLDIHWNVLSIPLLPHLITLSLMPLKPDKALRYCLEAPSAKNCTPSTTLLAPVAIVSPVLLANPPTLSPIL